MKESNNFIIYIYEKNSILVRKMIRMYTKNRGFLNYCAKELSRRCINGLDGLS